MSGTVSFRFEIELTDRELATASIREHVARSGALRAALGPAALALGVYGLATREGTGRWLALLVLAWGAFVVLRPFLVGWQLVSERRRRGAASALALVVDERGLELTRGGKSLVFPWKEVTAAGRRADYFWYEVRGKQRAPIPLRLVDDPAALEAFLRAHTRWSGC
jgi:hypothetical protein